jgi:prevent-host-death family protein
MLTVNTRNAKTNLSRLVDAVESGAEAEIIIARNGKPAARLVPIAAPKSMGKRIGLLAGKYPPMSLEDFDAGNDAIAAMLRGRKRLRLLLDAHVAIWALASPAGAPPVSGVEASGYFREAGYLLLEVTAEHAADVPVAVFNLHQR